MKDFLTTTEAAEFLGVSKSTIANLCMEGKVTYYRPGRDRFFRREDLVAYIESGRKEAVS